MVCGDLEIREDNRPGCGGQAGGQKWAEGPLDLIPLLPKNSLSITRIGGSITTHWKAVYPATGPPGKPLHGLFRLPYSSLLCLTTGPLHMLGPLLKHVFSFLRSLAPAQAPVPRSVLFKVPDLLPSHISTLLPHCVLKLLQSWRLFN